MARSVNKVILIGHLGKDPELSYLPSGQSVAKFTLATNYRHKDKSGEFKEETEWHNIVAWGKLGEFCTQYLAKGRQAFVEGRLRSRNWEDREGKTRTSIEIVANEVVPLGPRGEGMAEAPARTAAARTAQSDDSFAEAGSQEITDDDIPF
ncbi:MAG: single-stranded DNA-binding protein [Acidobacteria bacterium]|nr:single-stranded DNA-binding protein [Acidobacteriota bacterium]